MTFGSAEECNKASYQMDGQKVPKGTKKQQLAWVQALGFIDLMNDLKLCTGILLD